MSRTLSALCREHVPHLIKVEETTLREAGAWPGLSRIGEAAAPSKSGTIQRSTHLVRFRTVLANNANKTFSTYLLTGSCARISVSSCRMRLSFRFQIRREWNRRIGVWPQIRVRLGVHVVPARPVRRMLQLPVPIRDGRDAHPTSHPTPTVRRRALSSVPRR